MKKLLIFIILIVLHFSFCTLDMPDDPKPPKWNIKITKIPLFSADTMRIGKELKKKDFERTDTDSSLSYNKADMKSFYIGDKLKIKKQHKSFSDKIGTFRIKGGVSISHPIKFVDLYPGLDALIGTSAIIPAAAINPPISKDTNFDNFISVSIVSGGLDLEIFNQLGFVLGDNVIIDLIDTSDNNRLISRTNIDRINNGDTKEYFIDLSGQTISSQLEVNIYGGLVGSEGNVVTITDNSGFTVTVTPRDIVANKANAKLSAQKFILKSTVPVTTDSTLKVRTATIETGYINLSISNIYDFPADFTVVIPNFKDEFGVEKTVYKRVEQNTIGIIPIILDGCTLDIDNKDLEFETEMAILPESSEFYEMNSEDIMFAEIDMSEIILKKVTGDFELGTDFPAIKETVFEDPPDQFIGLSFLNPKLTLSISNSPFDNIDLNINNEAKRDGETRHLHIKPTIQKDETLVIDKNWTDIDDNTTSFVDILNMIPEKFTINGSVVVNGKNVEINKDDSIKVNYDINLPLEFSLQNASYSDIDSLKLKDDARDKIKEYAAKATILMTIENGIPIAGSMSFLVGNDSTNINTEILKITLPEPKELDPEGRVFIPGIDSIEISLDNVKFNIIAESYFYKYDLQLNNTEKAKLTANDYLIIKNVYLSGEVLVDPN